MLSNGYQPRLPTRGSKMIIDCAHYQDGHRSDEGAVPLEEAAARYGQGGLVVPLALLFLWLRLRTLHAPTAGAVHDS
jgi:hypothetical protein